jgi:hypothetical protein
VNRLVSTLLLAVVLASCTKNTSRPSAKLNGPQGVAVYRGYGLDQPGVLRPLVAVANTRGDDLRIIDAITDKPLEGPTLVAALSVPLEPRPSLIAAGSLHDRAVDGTEARKADLLVVAPRGQVPRPAPAAAGTFGAVIQVIVTWDDRTRVADSFDLGDLLPTAALTGLVVAPVPESDGAGGWRPAAGKARVLATSTDGALVSIEATRDATSDAILLGTPVVQLLGFAGLDLAVSSDGTGLYVATLDPIPPSGLLGVAELDNTAAPPAMAVRALSTRIGTTRVAALDVAPFLDNLPSTPELDSFGPAVPRVYAVLDPASCGRDRSVPCGIAVVDPALGALAADPAGELPFQLPIEVPGEVVDLTVSGPPKVSDRAGYLKFDPGSGLRWTQAFAAVSTTAGRVYLVDLSHFAVGNVVSPLVGTSTTRVVASGSYLPSNLSALDSAAIGTWYEAAGVESAVQFAASAKDGIAVTPGYTRSETFAVTYQGKLPGLSSRQAVIHVASGAPIRVAVQEATGLSGPGTSAWRTVARLYDPRLAVQVSDRVDVEVFPSGICPNGNVELVVTKLLPPDPLLYPGGAVEVVPAVPQPSGADAACLPQGDTAVTASFLAWDMVLVGSTSGYAGRPPVVPDTPESAPRFEFGYADEQALSCPIMPDDPEAWPPAQGAIDACQADVATCRETCERLVLARRARRSFYMTDSCPPVAGTTESACVARWVTTGGLTFPMPKGPVVAFKLGITDHALGMTLRRGTYMGFTTGSGLVQGSRAPSTSAESSGAAAPAGVTLFDRSAETGLPNDGLHGYAACSDNLILGFAPWSTGAPATTIR